MEKASKANNYYFNKDLQHLARENRRNMTKSAACLWKYVLGDKQMMGYQFRRERPILNYIVDFVCFELMLVVEVDGYTHEFEETAAYDRKRDERLQEIGFTVLRFSGWLVLNDINVVSNTLVEWINNNGFEPVPKRKRRQK